MSGVKLPEGWLLTSLEHTVDILDSMRVPVNNAERQSRIENKNSDELFPYYGATGEVGKIDGYIFDEELVALGEDGVPFLDSTKRKAYMLKGKTWVNNHAHVLKAIDGYSINTFIYYFLNQFNYQDYVNGGTRLKLTQANMRKIPICLPPLTEQKIIADKLDTLLAQVDNTKACLEKIPHILKRFRQAVLVAAVSGHLTEEWRAQNPEQTCTKVVSLGDIIIDGPQNGIYKPSSLYGSGHKIVRIDSFYEGVLSDWNTFKRVQLERSEVEKWSLRNNDILINRVNSIEYLGKCGLVENLPEVTVFESNIMRITLNSEKVVAKFVTIFLSSILGLSRLRENAKLAVNQASINQKDVKSCKIELPCISEQTEIVRRVEQFFAYADTIEKHVQNALERVNNLTQSILSKAVRGEFTAQWRAENPELISGANSAQLLLVKIQQQRTSIKNIKNRKGKS